MPILAHVKRVMRQICSAWRELNLDVWYSFCYRFANQTGKILWYYWFNKVKMVQTRWRGHL